MKMTLRLYLAVGLFCGARLFAADPFLAPIDWTQVEPIRMAKAEPAGEPAEAAPAAKPILQTQLFNAGEVGLDFFGYSRTSDFDIHNSRGGLGVGLSYYPLRTAGARVEVSSEDAQFSFIDASGVTLLGRLPVEKLRLALEYGVGFNYHFEGNRWLEKDSFTVHAEIGPRLRLHKNWDVWGKVRGVRAADTSRGEHVQFIVGTGLNF